jgi:hypothetical protein
VAWDAWRKFPILFQTRLTQSRTRTRCANCGRATQTFKGWSPAALSELSHETSGQLLS